MKYTLEKNITCDGGEGCILSLVDKLEKKFNCCLMSISDTDRPHGSVSVLHTNPHKISVCFYENEDVAKLTPQNKGGIQKLNNIPTKSEVENV